MKQKLTDSKKYEPQCLYCAYAKVLPDKEEVECRKKGKVKADNSCWRYKYDPIKRIPTQINLFTDFSEDDFKL